MTDPKLPTAEHPLAGAAAARVGPCLKAGRALPVFVLLPPKVKTHSGGVGFLCAGGGRAEHLRRQHLGPFCTSPPSFHPCRGLVPHILGDVIFLWCCNLLAHFINTYAVDDNFSQASVIRSYTKFMIGIAVSMLTYPFLLVGDLMAVNNCGLRAGLPPYAPAFTSWIHCWRHLSAQVRGTCRAWGSQCSFLRFLSHILRVL